MPRFDKSRPRGRRRNAGVKKHYWVMPMKQVPATDNTVRKEQLILWKSTFRKAIENNATMPWPERDAYIEVGRDALLELRSEYMERAISVWFDKAQSLLEHLDRIYDVEADI